MDTDLEKELFKKAAAETARQQYTMYAESTKAALYQMPDSMSNGAKKKMIANAHNMLRDERSKLEAIFNKEVEEYENQNTHKPTQDQIEQKE